FLPQHSAVELDRARNADRGRPELVAHAGGIVVHAARAANPTAKCGDTPGDCQAHAGSEDGAAKGRAPDRTRSGTCAAVGEGSASDRTGAAYPTRHGFRSAYGRAAVKSPGGVSRLE